MKISRIITLAALLSAAFALSAQELLFPLYEDYQLNIVKQAYSSNYRFHSSMRSWTESQLNAVADIDSIRRAQYIVKHFRNKWTGQLWNSAFNTDFAPVNGADGVTYLGDIQIDETDRTDKGDFYIAVNPLFDFQTGWQQYLDHSIWRNTRGAEVKGTIGEKFAFYTSARENQAVFPEYIRKLSRSTKVVPCQGHFKYYGDYGFDFTYCSAYLNFKPTEWLSTTMGYGKNFIGDGYRSLILSDNASSYPYLKLTGTIWNIQHTCLYTQMIDRENTISSTIGYARKYVTMHYTDWAVTRRFNMSLFDAIVWSAEDGTGFRGIDINYLNPIVFLRPVEYTVGPSPDNAIMGANMSYIFGKNTVLYGQIVLDEFKLKHIVNHDGWYANKQAFQLGMKDYDAFNVDNLFLQAEYNYVRPYMYTHYGQSQNYAHFNQALAHPLGANFWEAVARAQYNVGRIYLNYKFIFALYGEDFNDLTNGHCGHNIFLNYQHYLGYADGNELGHYVGQGIETHLVTNDLVLSYLVNPTYNFNVFVEVMRRRLTTQTTENKTMILNLGLRTSLENLYYDF